MSESDSEDFLSMEELVEELKSLRAKQASLETALNSQKPYIIPPIPLLDFSKEIGGSPALSEVRYTWLRDEWFSEWFVDGIFSRNLSSAEL